MNTYILSKRLILLFILLCLCPGIAHAGGGTATPSPCLHCSGKEHAGGETMQRDCQGSCGGHCDMVCICRKSKVAEGEKVKDMVIILSEGTVKGTVTGNCVVIGGKLHLGKDARMEGDLVALFSTIEKEKGAEIRGNYVNVGSLEISALPGFIRIILSGWDIFCALLVILLFSRLLARYNDKFLTVPAGSFVAGFLGIIAFVPLLILLTLSIVGIALIPLVPLFYLTGFIMGYAVIGACAGEKLLSRFTTLSPAVKRVVGLIMIAVVLRVFSLVPIAGPILSEIISMLIRTAGVGLLALMILESLKKGRHPFPHEA